MKRNNKGFSLVELLIAIAVSSIVLSALVTLIVQAVRSYSKQTALAQVQSDADISLNQISKNILEANEIQLVKTTNDGKSDMRSILKFNRKKPQVLPEEQVVVHQELLVKSGVTGMIQPTRFYITLIMMIVILQRLTRALFVIMWKHLMYR